MDEASDGRPPPPASPSPSPPSRVAADVSESFLLERVRSSGLSPDALAELVEAMSSGPAVDTTPATPASGYSQPFLDPRIQAVLQRVMTSGTKRPRMSDSSLSPEGKRERRERANEPEQHPADPAAAEQLTPHRRRRDPRLNRSHSTGVLPSRAADSSAEEDEARMPAPLPPRQSRRARVVVPALPPPLTSGSVRPAHMAIPSTAGAGTARRSDATRAAPTSSTASRQTIQPGSSRYDLTARLAADVQRITPLGARPSAADQSYAGATRFSGTARPGAAAQQLGAARPGPPARAGAATLVSGPRPGIAARPSAPPAKVAPAARPGPAAQLMGAIRPVQPVSTARSGFAAQPVSTARSGFPAQPVSTARSGFSVPPTPSTGSDLTAPAGDFRPGTSTAASKPQLSAARPTTAQVAADYPDASFVRPETKPSTAAPDFSAPDAPRLDPQGLGGSVDSGTRAISYAAAIGTKPSASSTGDAEMDTSVPPTGSNRAPQPRFPPFVVETMPNWAIHFRVLRVKLGHVVNARPFGKGIRFLPRTETEFREVQRYLVHLEKTENISWFSYSLPAERSLKVAIRGLPANTEERDIAEALRELGYEPEFVRQIRARVGASGCLFFAQLRKSPDCSTAALFNTTELLNIAGVKFEAWRGKKGPAQCHRCQQFRHSSHMCHRPQACVRCGGGHPAKECPRSREDPPTCANCGGEHTANNTSCPVFRREIRNRAAGTVALTTVARAPVSVPAKTGRKEAKAPSLPTTLRPAANDPRPKDAVPKRKGQRGRKRKSRKAPADSAPLAQRGEPSAPLPQATPSEPSFTLKDVATIFLDMIRAIEAGADPRSAMATGLAGLAVSRAE